MNQAKHWIATRHFDVGTERPFPGDQFVTCATDDGLLEVYFRGQTAVFGSKFITAVAKPRS